MKLNLWILASLAGLVPAALLLLAGLPMTAEEQKPPEEVVLAVHGGAGVLERARMTPALEKQYRAALEEALRAGYQALQKEDGTSLDAVEAAIRVLEDNPLFNAGKGAVFTHDGRNELDASIMEGKGRRGGAVAGVSTVKNPISAARAVMEKSPHVLMVGRGAELFAAGQGLEAVDPSYFWTLQRWQQLQRALQEDSKETPRGTVGAVALDRHGNLAAGTSTGGMTNKRFGRVGDSPILGAGTYADNGACAVSGTGHGEVFIRFAVAHDIAALVKYRQMGVHEAARTVLAGLPEEPGGVGGVIVLDRQGRCAQVYNTEGMYRGQVSRGGKVQVTIYDR